MNSIKRKLRDLKSRKGNSNSISLMGVLEIKNYRNKGKSILKEEITELSKTKEEINFYIKGKKTVI